MSSSAAQSGQVRPPDALSVMPPPVRIGAGLLMLAMGIGGLLMMPIGLWSAVLAALTFVVGLPLLVGGLRDRRVQRIEREERARAEAELPRLREEVAACVERRHSVPRLLKQRGYTSPKVRRWIALECDVVLSSGGG